MPRRQTLRNRRKQSGGADHIYTVPLESMYDVLYDAAHELLDLRSKCQSVCVQKLCSGRNTVRCNQTRRMSRYHSAYEFASSLCHAQLVRMTDPTGSMCQGPRPSSNCLCAAYAAKYTELERLISELTRFLTNYHTDTPMKQYIIKIRNVGQQILAFLDNFGVVSEFNKIPSDMRTKSINDIMQTAEFKNALRVATATSPRPISAPARLDTSRSAASRRLVVPPLRLESAVAPSTRLLTLTHMNEEEP